MLTLKCKNCGVDFSRPAWKSYQKYCSLKCRIPWNKNKKGIFSKETIEKIKIARAKQKCPSGKDHWNYDGKIYKKICQLCQKEFIRRKNCSKILWDKQKFCSMKCTATYASSFSPKGENHGQWKGGVSKLAMKIRKMKKYLEWRLAIYERDEFTCRECKEIGGKLNADHIISFAFILQTYQIKTLDEARKCEELWNINNGRTLCKDCHSETETYGSKTRVLKNLHHNKYTKGQLLST